MAQFIKFTDTSAPEQSLIENMIKACRQHFERKCGLSFAQKTFETLFRPWDKPFILPVMPVITVDKVETVDYQGTKEELTLNSEYYKRGTMQVEIQTSSVTGLSNPWRDGESSYDLLVTYKAGYGHANTETLPEALREAMRRQVMQWYDNRDDFYELKFLGSIEAILRNYTAFII